MSNTDFHLDTRIVGETVISLHDDKAKFSCTIEENWEEILLRILSCGAEWSRTLIHRKGFERVAKQDLEAAVKATLGSLGLPQLGLAIKGSTGLELHFEEFHEVQETFKFDVPKCGRRTVLLYQLKRTFTFSYYDSRFFHKDSWTKRLIQWVDRIHDASKLTSNDPNCGCPDDPRPPLHGLLYVDAGNISLLTPYRVIPDGVLLPVIDARTSLGINQIADLVTILPTSVFPKYLLFLGGVSDNQLTVRFHLYLEDWSSATHLRIQQDPALLQVEDLFTRDEVSEPGASAGTAEA